MLGDLRVERTLIGSQEARESLGSNFGQSLDGKTLEGASAGVRRLEAPSGGLDGLWSVLSTDSLEDVEHLVVGLEVLLGSWGFCVAPAMVQFDRRA